MKWLAYLLLLANAIVAFVGLVIVIPSGEISPQLIDRAASDGNIDKLRSMIAVLQASQETTNLFFLICAALLASSSVVIWVTMSKR